MITVYISNNNIQVLIGESNGKKTTVSKVYTTQAPMGSIINGMVTNEVDYTTHIKQFWEENKLPKKDVALVISSSHFVTKTVDLPIVSDRKTVEFLQKELQEVVRAKEPLYTYVTISEDKKAKMRQVLAVVIEKTFVGKHVSIFKEMGIEISHFDAALSCAIRAVKSMPAVQSDVSVTHIMESANMMNLLFVDGVYTFSNTTRLFSEHGTPGFGVEVARAVSTMQQFVKTQSLEKPLHSIYLAGTEDGDYEYCRECITQINNDVDVQMLPNHGSIVFKAPDAKGDFTSYIVAIGCMMAAGSKNKLIKQFSGLYEQYVLDPKGDKNVQDLKKYVKPFCALVAVGVVVSVAMGVVCIVNKARIARIEAFMSTPEVADTVAEYDNLVASNNELARQQTDVDNVWKYVDSFPTLNTEVDSILQSHADGLADVNITEFNAKSGVLEVETKASDVDLIHSYIDVIKDDPIFYDINYTGYSYNDSDALWTVKVECTLSDVAGKSLSNIYSDTGIENYNNVMGLNNEEEETEAETEEVEE